MALLEKHLLIKRSTISKAGKGLFTIIDIPFGTIITEYKGKVSSWQDVDHNNGKNRYIYYINKHKVIDARESINAFARYANDAKGPFRLDGVKNNSMYIVINNRVFIKSIKNISAGSEILVGYGKNYWDTIKENELL